MYVNTNYNKKNIQAFSRYEFKYILNKDLSNKIERESKYFMKFDDHTKKNLENRYFVRSLYFDNRFSSNFYEKVDGMKIRNKYSKSKAKRKFYILKVLPRIHKNS